VFDGAKLTEDDGTARNKVTRVQHLAALSARGDAGRHVRLDFAPCLAQSRAR